VKEIVLATINAKWIHPSLALRLLKANLGALEEKCEIIDFALRQPLGEMLENLLAVRPRILGISVSIWNHTATIELLAELEKAWAARTERPIVILGGPEVSHLPVSAEIFKNADYVIRGEGEDAFRTLCENVLTSENHQPPQETPQFINAAPVNLETIKNGYHLYTDVDLTKKLIYVEASRGCPFNCEFCLSAVKDAGDSAVREFPLEPFLAQMDALVKHGSAHNGMTFKFLDRTFNLNIKRALRIIDFFLEKIEEREKLGKKDIVVHFEMVASLFPHELREALSHFPPGTLRLEIGIQTLNPEVAARICRPSNPEKELETLRSLREKTNAIIHADLIAGLPGEDFASFGGGFDRLWLALCGTETLTEEHSRATTRRAEIQLGILKLLPGAPISRHSENFAMRYNNLPPYEILETSAMSARDLARIKNFARFWELIINRGLVNFAEEKQVFEKFLTLSDSLFAHFGRNWGIDKNELLEFIEGKDQPEKCHTGTESSEENGFSRRKSGSQSLPVTSS
jgi:radical SAM superfamily enzyme YgiQ (UPF0313 family)